MPTKGKYSLKKKSKDPIKEEVKNEVEIKPVVSSPVEQISSAESKSTVESNEEKSQTDNGVPDSPKKPEAEVKQEEPVSQVTPKKTPEKSSKSKRKTKKSAKPSKVESPSWKITDFFPIRRSNRRTAAELKKEAENSVESKIRCGCEEGLKVVESPVKGRGVVAEKEFRKGEFVIEYRGDLIDPDTARAREKAYAEDSQVGCYMYYFRFGNRNYCVDATAESGYLGRLVNHSAKKPNLSTKSVSVDGIPHLILIAGKDISIGDELLYDYGDRDKEAIQANPWLKNT